MYLPFAVVAIRATGVVGGASMFAGVATNCINNSKSNDKPLSNK